MRFLDLSVSRQNLSMPLRRLISNGGAQFEREWPYRTGRFADLAVLANGRPVMLFEVKENDVASPRNPAQLADYLHHVATEADPPHFFHLSRYTPISAPPALRAAAQSGRVHDLRYRDLYRAMRDHEGARGQQTPIARMVREYLEDIGVNVYQSLNLDEDRTALTFLVTQMSGFDHFHGLGRLHSADNAMRGPDLLKTLLGNAAAFGDWLAEPNHGLFRQKPKSRFLVTRQYHPRRLASAIASHDKEDDFVEPQRKAVGEGTLHVYTMAALSRSIDGPGKWAYVELGQFVTVSASKREHARTALYAALSWSGGGEAYADGDWLSPFPSEAEATAELCTHLQTAVDQAREEDDYPSIFDRLVIPAART
ncbi:MAG: hypothetical protein JSR79_07880 [Proteobacteria bacterium]|nr:hypothetical protein [Pseudomonadota bacterium]